MGPLSAPRFFGWDDSEREAAVNAARTQRLQAALQDPLADPIAYLDSAPYDPWAMSEADQWNMPGVQARLQGLINQIGPQAGFTKIMPGAMKAWRQLMQAGYTPEKSWSTMRHTPEYTNYGPSGRTLDYRMYRSQKDFDTGAKLAIDFASEAARIGKLRYSDYVLNWLKNRAQEVGFSINDPRFWELLKGGPQK